MKHIGIVACSSEGAALCYQTICRESVEVLGRYLHPEISMHAHPLIKYMNNIENYDWNGVAELMLSSANKIAKIGADFLISPDNTIHQSMGIVKTQTPLPWLHIAEELSKVAEKQKFKKVGILGTKYLMEGTVYSNILKDKNIDYVIPKTNQRIRINKIIFDELIKGKIVEKSKKFLLSIIKELKLRGCDSLVLGCTELPLIIFSNESPLPVLDSTRILARAALNYAIDK